VNDWFPRPRSVHDLVWLGPSGELDVDRLFALLVSPLAREWRDKVGVTSPDDGSAKASTRLLQVEGWVFKTDTGAAGSREASLRGVAKLLQLAARAELWHPDKRWFLLRTVDDRGERWWPISACPEVVTLRRVREWERFAPLWASALAMGLELARHKAIGLDLNPANFGVAPEAADGDEFAGQLWYIDDETYGPLEVTDIAEAIVGRIPEWPRINLERWREFGRLLRGLLEPILTRPADWAALSEALAQALIAQRWSSARAALLDGVERRGPPSAPTLRRLATAQRTALISDVHANLPALEAVIAHAEREGVDSWMFLGDAVGYGPHPRECVARLASLSGLTGLRGNHDHMACFGLDAGANSMALSSLRYARAKLGEREREWLMALPVELLGPDWLAVHGAPVDPLRFNAYVYAMSYHRNLAHLEAGSRRLCFHGHTHVPMVYRRGATPEAVAEAVPIDRDAGHEGVAINVHALRGGGAMLVNPGSVGQPRDGDPRAGFAIWERAAGCIRFHRVAYDVASTCADILAAGLPEDLATRLELGR